MNQDVDYLICNFKPNYNCFRFDLFFSDEEGPISRQHLLDSVSDKEALFCLLTDKIDQQVLQKAQKLKVIGQCLWIRSYLKHSRIFSWFIVPFLAILAYLWRNK